MKRLLLASVAAIATGTVATAQPAPPVANWGGCRIGIQAGAGWNHTDFTDPTGFRIAPVGSTVKSDSNAGALGGLQLGCDYQFAQNWVLGLAGDFSFADISHDEVDPFFAGKAPGAPLTVHARTQALGSVTARLGYGWNQYLLYVKGGPAWAREKYAVNNFSCFIFTPCYSSTTETRSGWTAGVGFEWAFARNWSTSIEYSHYGFGDRNFTFTDGATGITSTFGVKSDIDVVKVGLAYHFGVPFR